MTQTAEKTGPGGEAAPLSIIAGGGTVPLIVARAAAAANRPVQIVGLEGEADPGIAAFPHRWVKWGQLGTVENLLRAHGSGDVVIVGSVSGRPDFRNIGLDFGTARLLPEILSVAMGGDDSVLTGAVRLLERRGFRVVGAHEVARELVAEPGCLTRRRPSDKERKDAALAAAAALAIGRIDAGQAAVAIESRVVALEGAEGTDAVLARVRQLRNERRVSWRDRAGVLAKCAKPQQDLRVDMPAIGPRTAEAAAAAGLAGIFVEAGRVMLIDRDEIVQLADRAGLFVLAGDPDREGGPTG